MVNQEIFGGLVSALSRGESLQKAMMSMFNAGYSKKEIEEAAMLLKSKTPAEVIQKTVQDSKESMIKKPSSVQNKKIIKVNENITGKTETNPKTQKPEGGKTKQKVSRYGEESPEEFKKVIDEAIKSLSDMKSPTKVLRSGYDSRPPIIIQHVSGYSDYNRGKSVGKPVIILLFVLLVVLLGSLVALFVFKNRIIEIFNNLGF